jgi:hypothetical protein
VAASAPHEVIEQIKQNKMSINQAYNLARKKPKAEAGEFATIRARMSQSALQSMVNSSAAQAAFRELAARLQALETAGEIAAPASQDMALLLRPLLGGALEAEADGNSDDQRWGRLAASPHGGGQDTHREVGLQNDLLLVSPLQRRENA